MLTELARKEGTKLARQLINTKLFKNVGQSKTDKGLKDVRDLTRDDLNAIAGGTSITPEDHDHLKEAVTVTVNDAFDIVNPEGGQGVSLGRFGFLRTGGASLFIESKGVGDLSLLNPRDGLYVLLRIDAVVASDVKPLDQVKAEIIDYLAGKEAYAEFVSKVQELGSTIAAIEGATLAKYFDSEERKKTWNAVASDTTKDPLEEIQAPGESPDALGEDKSYLSLADEGNSIFVAAVPISESAKSLRAMKPKLQIGASRQLPTSRDTKFRRN